MHDPADDPAIVYPLDAAHIPRQIRPNSSPLLVAQPKQILAHDPDPLPKTNQDRILRAQMLMSFDPSSLGTTRRFPPPWSAEELFVATDRPIRSSP